MKKSSSLKVDMISRLRLESETSDWVKKDMRLDPKGYGNAPSRATEFFHWYSVHRKGFLINLIQLHYEEIKHLVRMIGRARKESGI